MREAQKILDEIAHEIQTAVDDIKRNAPKYVKIPPEWKTRSKSSDAFRKVKQMPDRLSDLTVDGSCAMRYLFGYTLKGFSVILVLAGLATIAVSRGGRLEFTQALRWPFPRHHRPTLLGSRASGPSVRRSETLWSISAPSAEVGSRKRWVSHRAGSSYRHPDHC